MELRHLRYYIAVAEELHFGRAAERLFMSQPPLSQQIRQLEEELETVLLERTSRSVSLTPAGESFLEDARRILAEVDEAAERARAVARGEEGRLHLGFMGHSLMSDFPLCIREFNRQYPRIRMELSENSTTGQLDALSKGDLDVGLISYLHQPLEGLESLSFQREPFVLCMPEGHYLTHLKTVPVKRLDEVPLIMFPRESHPALYDALITGFHDLGISPRIVQDALRIETGRALVAAGMGLSIQPRSASRIQRPGVTYRPLEGPFPEPELRVVWKAGSKTPALKRFLEVVGKFRDEL